MQEKISQSLMSHKDPEILETVKLQFFVFRSQTKLRMENSTDWWYYHGIHVWYIFKYTYIYVVDLYGGCG